jgi:carbon storage regulator
MLVLTRRSNEQITIGQHEITVKVLEVRGGRVRIGIDAPKHVRIERVESTAGDLCALPAGGRN